MDVLLERVNVACGGWGGLVLSVLEIRSCSWTVLGSWRVYHIRRNKVSGVLEDCGPVRSGQGVPPDATIRRKFLVLLLLSADSDPQGPCPQGEARTHISTTARGRSCFVELIGSSKRVVEDKWSVISAKDLNTFVFEYSIPRIHHNRFCQAQVVSMYVQVTIYIFQRSVLAYSWTSRRRVFCYDR